MDTTITITTTKSKRPINWWIGLLYLVLGLVFSYIYFRYRKFIWGDDFSFHMARLSELLQVKLTQFPYLATHTFGQTGNLVNLFYPAQLLYPLVILIKLTHHPVLALYVYVGLCNLLSLILCDFAAYKVTKKRLVSVSFAILYTFSFYRMQVLYTRFDLGEFLATMFVPLAFASFYCVTQQRGGQKALILAMVGLVFSHVLTTLLVIISLVVWYVVLVIRRALSWSQTKAYLKATLWTLGLTVWYWGPFIQHYVMTPSGLKATQVAPTQMKAYSWTAQKMALRHNLTFPAHTAGPVILGLSLVLLLYLIVRWRKLSVAWKVIFALSLVSFWLMTPSFPWFLFKNSVINTLQFPFRLNLFYTFGITWCTAQVLGQITARKGRLVLTTLVLLLSCGATLNSMQKVVNYRFNWDKINLTDANFDQYADNPIPNDYYPKSAQKVIKMLPWGQGYVNDQKKLFHPVGGFNQLTYHFQTKFQTAQVQLPLIYYGPLYQVRLNQHLVPAYGSAHGLLTVQTTKRANQVTVTYQPTKVDRWSFKISCLVLLIFVIVSCTHVDLTIKQES